MQPRTGVGNGKAAIGETVTTNDENSATAARSNTARRRHKGATFQHRLEYVGVRIVGAIFRALPVEWVSAATGWTMGLVMPHTSRHKRALENLAFAMPELSDAEREGIARRMWTNLGRVSGEAFQIDRLVEDASRVELPANYHLLDTAARTGVIAATPHLGNWEITGVLPRRSNLPFAAIYQELHNPYVERYLKAMREPAYPSGLYAKGPQLGQRLVRLAREGVNIGMAADFRELRGIPVTFFGQEAYATPLPAMLARLSGRPLVAGAIVRTGGVRFRMELRFIDVPETDDRDADIQAATQALHDAFESFIRLAPDQWMWSHRKWARRAPALSEAPSAST